MQRKWLDGNILNERKFPKSSLNYKSPLSCMREGNCTMQETKPLFQGDECSAVVVHEGFTDYSITPVACNVSHPVSLFCEFVHNSKDHLQNSLSDVKVNRIGSSGYHRLINDISCPHGSFHVDDMCIYIETFQDCDSMNCNNTQKTQCSGSFADKVFHNTSVLSNLSIDESSVLGKFWSVFQPKLVIPERINTIKQTVIIRINATSLCERIYNASNCHLKATMLRSTQPFNDTDDFFWSLIGQPELNPNTELTIPDFILCESQSFNARFASKCSQEYMTCLDGTCIHDALVCDGIEHCLHGEDEDNCHHACDDPNINCLTECHYENLCRCSDDFFQCFSGGCIPLQKLCDMTVHCADSSDEPNTCDYIQREESMENYSIPCTPIDDYLPPYTIRSDKRDCSGILVHPFQPVGYHINKNNTEYKVTYEQLSVEHESKGFCTDWSYVITKFVMVDRNPYPVRRTMHQHFPLEQICTYHGADGGICENGFHLLNCDAFYCINKFKCPKSYCILRYYVCNGVCDCLHCEDESFCKKMVCPDMLLLEHLGSGLQCIDLDVKKYKEALNRRQIISTNRKTISDNLAVYVNIQDGSYLLSKFIMSPGIISYLIIHNHTFSEMHPTSFQGMTDLQTLDISHNSIRVIHTFSKMSLLKLLNISQNYLTIIPEKFLHQFKFLNYIYLQNNRIRFIHSNTFSYSLNLKVIMIQLNNLNPLSVTLTGMLPSLHHLFSDLPTFCCIFEVQGQCSPPFHSFMSCSNMISSKLLVATIWFIGIITFFLNTASIVTLIHTLRSKCIEKATSIIMGLALNLNFCELLTSGCLLSYPFFNMYYDGNFGIIAGKWRKSIQCFVLELVFFISSQVALISAAHSAIHTAVYIPSIRRKSRKRMTFFIIAFAWILIFSISFLVKYFQPIDTEELTNYFCLPFITSSPTISMDSLFYILFLSLDFCLAILCVVCYSYLMVFTYRQGKAKIRRNTKNRALQKVAFRMAALMITTLITWIPVLIIQILAMTSISIHPNSFFWVVITSLPANLLIDPLLIIRSVIKTK